MPQTSPMNWMMISNLFIFFILMNQLLMISFIEENTKSFLLICNKNWMW